MDISEILEQKVRRKYPHLSIERRDKDCFKIKTDDALIQTRFADGYKLIFQFTVFPAELNSLGQWIPLEKFFPETERILLFINLQAFNLSSHKVNLKKEWGYLEEVCISLAEKLPGFQYKIEDTNTSPGNIWRVHGSYPTIEWQIGKGFTVKGQVYPDSSSLESCLRTII